MEVGTGGQAWAQPQPSKAQPLSMDLVGLKTARSLCWQLWLLREHSQQGGPNFNEKKAMGVGVAPHRSAPESPQEVTAGSAQVWEKGTGTEGKSVRNPLEVAGGSWGRTGKGVRKRDLLAQMQACVCATLSPLPRSKHPLPPF